SFPSLRGAGKMLNIEKEFRSPEAISLIGSYKAIKRLHRRRLTLSDHIDRLAPPRNEISRSTGSFGGASLDVTLLIDGSLLAIRSGMQSSHEPWLRGRFRHCEGLERC